MNLYALREQGVETLDQIFALRAISGPVKRKELQAEGLDEWLSKTGKASGTRYEVREDIQVMLAENEDGEIEEAAPADAAGPTETPTPLALYVNKDLALGTCFIRNGRFILRLVGGDDFYDIPEGETVWGPVTI